VELRGNVLAPTDLGGIFEKGRRGGETILPKNALALKIGDGFAASAIEGPMAPKPYIGPAAVRWANGGFQSTARASLAAQGF
jgi:hypothetical protein